MTPNFASVGSSGVSKKKIEFSPKMSFFRFCRCQGRFSICSKLLQKCPCLTPNFASVGASGVLRLNPDFMKKCRFAFVSVPATFFYMLSVACDVSLCQCYFRFCRCQGRFSSSCAFLQLCLCFASLGVSSFKKKKPSNFITFLEID